MSFTPQVLIEFGPDDAPALFEAPREIICAWNADEVPAALERMDKRQRSGKWLAGYLSYELGYALEPRLAPLMPEGRRAPLILMGVFDQPREAKTYLDAAADASHTAALGIPQPDWGERQYRPAFDKVADYIRAGDCYQVNLTMPLRCMASGSPAAIYAALRSIQPVGFGALVDLGQGPVVLSRSPELFFKLSSGGQIETWPMKGTMPRDPDPVTDRANAAFLASDEKNRAENLMIVDLMRNDLSRLCEVGSVKVPELFRVDTYQTVHQMISRITGQLRQGVGVGDLVRSLFPCGSITGAPKIRAMEIIRELESRPRDVYCGSIGWVAPDGSARFNVAIRTISLFEGREVVLNVGGGVVYDSNAESEYEEALWKARYARTT